MAFGRTRKDYESEINLAPLIDILFIVLIFLVLTTSFSRRTGIDLRLPESTQQRAEAPPEAVRIELSREGELFLDGKPVTVEALGEALAARQSKDTPVVLAADREAHHGTVVEILDVVRNAGFRKLAVQAQSRGGS